MLKNNQKIRFSGAFASHQNGELEQAINTVVTMAGTMLMHAAFRCTEGKLSANIWPMVMDYYLWFYNRIPDVQSILSAIELCPRSKFGTMSETLSNFHVWGCPAYVLDPKLQNSVGNIPKWYPRSQRGVNMGFININ